MVTAERVKARKRNTQGHTMPVTKDDVLAALGQVASPDGTPLPKTGTLSDTVHYKAGRSAASYGGAEPRISMRHILSKNSSCKTL